MGRLKSPRKSSNQASRIIVRIELVKGAKRTLEDVCEARGMTQLSVTSRLVEWFAKQPLMIQSSIMGQYDGVDVADAILKEMTGKGGRRKA